MIRGNIPIPGKHPKSRRNRDDKPKPIALDITTIIECVKSPQEIKRQRRIQRLRELTGAFRVCR
jgi:hypothetical protein